MLSPSNHLDGPWLEQVSGRRFRAESPTMGPYAPVQVPAVVVLSPRTATP